MMRKSFDYDFSGWVTRNDILCSDGRTIRKDAFAHNDGETVPLIWNHDHHEASNVLGHIVLENRNEGVYGYGKFNNTSEGVHAKELVHSGDIRHLSIYANGLKQDGGNVIHGNIREVSLVLSGANRGAFIDTVIEHSEWADEEAIIYTPTDSPFELSHGEEDEEETNMAGEERTVQDVIDEMTEEQKDVMFYLIGEAAENAEDNEDDEEDEEDYDEGEDDDMKHSIWDGEVAGDYLRHAEDLTAEENAAIFDDARRCGSLRDAFLAHAEDYGLDPHMEYLYPEDHELYPTPEFIKRDQNWVDKVMGGVHHVPFSRIKMTFADITEEEARAKGYFKGNYKKHEVFGFLRRRTDPQTVYKKQKMDRDDLIDITTLDAAAFLKKEMRMMLNEELARAFLLGDDRPNDSEDKIQEEHIRPIWKMEDFFTVHVPLVQEPGQTEAKALIKTIKRSRKNYKGSGNIVCFTTEDFLTEMLMIEDGIGRPLYETEERLSTVLRCKQIVTVPVMEDIQHPRVDAAGNSYLPMAILVDLDDYTVGADKGGAVEMFEDFDIDYNAEKYLIETRCSGTLTKYHSAIAIEKLQTVGLTVTPEDPTEEISGKLVSALQTDVYVNSTTVGGTLKYVTGYTGYSLDPNKQEGHYVALKAVGIGENDTVTAELLNSTEGIKTLTSDNNVVFRVEDRANQKIRFVVTNADGDKLTRVYSLARLTLAPEE